jgi:hypothetical protein
MDPTDDQLEGGRDVSQMKRVHDAIIQSVIHNATEERTMTHGEVIMLLENLLTAPKLSTAAVYEALRHEQTSLIRRIAERAFDAGLKEAQEPGLRTDE